MDPTQGNKTTVMNTKKLTPFCDVESQNWVRDRETFVESPDDRRPTEVGTVPPRDLMEPRATT